MKVSIPIERWIKESDKAHLVMSKGIELWLPKSIVTIDQLDSTHVLCQNAQIAETKRLNLMAGAQVAIMPGEKQPGNP